MTSNVPIIAPFRGVRYNLKKVPDLSPVTAPPYDVISEEGQGRLYEKSPYNVVRLILGKESPADTDRDNRYTRAARDFNSWLASSVLIRDDEPSFYLYEQGFELKGRGRFVRRGFLALRRLEAFEKGKIRPHEKTLSGPKKDRLLLIKACGANFSPIFSLYSDPSFSRALEPFFAARPEADFVDEEEVRHRFWRAADRELFLEADRILGEKNLFIADGHHRYETAIAYRDWMKTQYPDAPEDASFNYVMMFFGEMADPGLVVLPTHRVLRNRAGFDAGKFKRRLEDFFESKPFDPGRKDSFLRELEASQDRHALGLLLPGGSAFYLLLPKPVAVQSVDTAILHQTILRGILGFQDDDEKNPDYLRFIKEEEEGFAALRDPEVNAVFLINPPRMDDLRQVVESGQILPPKTTYFYPKLLTGLVMNRIDPAEKVSID